MFELHDIVAIAEQVVTEELNASTYDDSSHQHDLQVHARVTEKLINGSYDNGMDEAERIWSEHTGHPIRPLDREDPCRPNVEDFLCAPLTYKFTASPRDWLGMVKILRSSDANHPVQKGWWCEVAGRLLHITNTSDYRFYVSDLGSKTHVSSSLKNHFFFNLDSAWSPSMLQQVLARCIILKDLDSRSKLILDNIKELTEYASEMLLSILTTMFLFREEDSDRFPFPVFYKVCLDLYTTDVSDSESTSSRHSRSRRGQRGKRSSSLSVPASSSPPPLLRRMVGTLLAIAGNAFNDGWMDAYVRCKTLAYGNDKHTYPQFKEAIVEMIALASRQHMYQGSVSDSAGSNPSSRTGTCSSTIFDRRSDGDKTVLSTLRCALVGHPKAKELFSHSLEGSHRCLPLLIGAWFIAEPARRPSSFLSGSVLLDLIESSSMLSDDDPQSNGCTYDWYDWRCVLQRPYYALRDNRLLPTVPTYCSDLYGRQVKVADFAGMHPMTHYQSATDRPLQTGSKLTIAQQKEGALLIHWLLLFFQTQLPDSTGVASSCACEDVTSNLCDPCRSSLLHSYSTATAPTVTDRQKWKVQVSGRTIRQSPLQPSPKYEIKDPEAADRVAGKRWTKEATHSKGPQLAIEFDRIRRKVRLTALIRLALMARFTGFGISWLNGPGGPNKRGALSQFCSSYAMRIFSPNHCLKPTCPNSQMPKRCCNSIRLTHSH